MKVAFKKKSTNIYDRLIKWWLRGKYAHCELILSENGNDNYLCASSVAGKGVRVEVLNLTADGWDFLDVPVNEADAEAWFHAHDGQGYDYYGIFSFILPPLAIQKKTKWFCSEAVMAAFGYDEPHLFDPDRMYAVLATKVAK